MKEFEQLCESLGVIKKTTRIMYPRQIKLSETFLAALKEEYYRQKLEEDASGEIKNRPEKFLKAMGFHLQELEENSVMELEAMRRKMEEDTTYNVITDPEKKPAKKETKSDGKKLEKEKARIVKDNMTPKTHVVESTHIDFPTKAEALKFLKNHGSKSVGWKEGANKKVAIYWNGKLHITDADAEKRWYTPNTHKL